MVCCNSVYCSFSVQVFRQQHIERSLLVLVSHGYSSNERCLCLFLWNNLWKEVYQGSFSRIIPQQNVGGNKSNIFLYLSNITRHYFQGFIGALLLTMIFSFYFPALLAQFSWLVCPADGLYIWPFPPPLSCEPNPAFIKSTVHLSLFGDVLLYPIQLHGR